jgi:DNA polymerase III subunit beta
MDVTLPKRDLLKILARTQGVADRKSTMPILSNALLTASAEAEALRASATDLFWR